MERLCVSWSDGFDSSNGETCKLRDSDAIIFASALNNGLVAFSGGVDLGSRFAERLSVSGRRSIAAQTLENDASNVNSALIDSWVSSVVVRFRLRRDDDELLRGDDRDV
jgi:hypothetical protein